MYFFQIIFIYILLRDITCVMIISLTVITKYSSFKKGSKLGCTNSLAADGSPHMGFEVNFQNYGLDWFRNSDNDKLINPYENVYLLSSAKYTKKHYNYFCVRTFNSSIFLLKHIIIIVASDITQNIFSSIIL